MAFNDEILFEFFVKNYAEFCVCTKLLQQMRKICVFEINAIHSTK